MTELDALNSVSSMVQSLQRIDLERDVSVLLGKRTELLKKHIACLKLHEQVREALDEAQSKEDASVQERYSSLLSQMEDEMKQIGAKREVVDASLQEKMSLLGEDSKKLLGLDDAQTSKVTTTRRSLSNQTCPSAAPAAPAISVAALPPVPPKTTATPAMLTAPTKLTSLEIQRNIAELKRQRAVTVQQLSDCSRLFEEVAQQAVAAAQNAESDAEAVIARSKCVTLLGRIEKEMVELRERSNGIEDNIMQQTTELATMGVGAVSAERESKQVGRAGNLSGETVQEEEAVVADMGSTTGAKMTHPAKSKVDTQIATPSAADTKKDSADVGAEAALELAKIKLSAEPGMEMVDFGDDNFSAALQQLDARDAELRAARDGLGDMEGQIREMYESIENVNA